jgi:ABC-2 type transport system permease protein
MRYYFLIYINQALNGLDWIYSFDYFAALLTFPLAALVFLPLLKRALLKPIKYIE